MDGALIGLSGERQAYGLKAEHKPLVLQGGYANKAFTRTGDANTQASGHTESTRTIVMLMMTKKSPHPTHLPCTICGELIEIDKRYRSRTTKATHPDCLDKSRSVEPEPFLKYLRENREKVHEIWELIRSTEIQNGHQ